MKTLERKFSKSERIVAKAKFSCSVYIGCVILALVLGGIVGALWIFGPQIEGLFSPNDGTAKYLTDSVMRWVLLGAAGVVLISVVFTAIDLYSKEFIVTEDKIVFREGVAAVRDVVIPLSEIRIIETNQSAMQRLLGIGTVTIISDAVKPYKIKGIKSADRFTRRILRQLSEVRKANGSQRFTLQLVPTRPAAKKR